MTSQTPENPSFRISLHELNYVWNCFHQSPIIHMCSHLISSQLLNNGIKFCEGSCRDNLIDMDAQKELLIEEKWVPFCADLIESILAYGFAVVHVGDFPSVLKIGTYWLKVEILESGYDWKVYKRASGDEEMKNTYVFSVYDPLTDGTLNSPVYKVIPRLLFLKRLRETAITMETLRANPVVYSEIKEVQAQTEKEGADFNQYADATAAETDDSYKFKRNKEQIAILNQQKDLYDQYLGKRRAGAARKSLDGVVPLPIGHTVKAPPMNTGRTDLTNLHKIIEEEVCATLGVPRSMIISDAGGGLNSGSVNTESTHETFMHTLIWWKKKIGIILSDLYNMIYIEELKKKIKDESDPYEAKRKHSVNVYFPVTPFVKNETLRQLYEQGVISWHKYAMYALMNVSLPIDDMEDNPPEIDELLFEKPKEDTTAPPAKRQKKE